jgi:hypothetical protein
MSMTDLSPMKNSCDSASPRKPIEITLVEELSDSSFSVEITNDDLCNFSASHMQEQPLRSESKAVTQLPRKKTKKTKLNIVDIQNEKALDEIVEEGDCDETIVDYVHNVDMINDEEYMMLYSGKQETKKVDIVTEDNVVTTNYTSKKVNTDEQSDKCVIF